MSELCVISFLCSQTPTILSDVLQQVFTKKGIYEKKKTTIDIENRIEGFVVIISNFLSQLLLPLPKLQQNHLCALCTSKILTLLLY